MMPATSTAKTAAVADTSCLVAPGKFRQLIRHRWRARGDRFILTKNGRMSAAKSDAEE